MKVSELTGALLDYWVARAEGKDAEVRNYEMAYGTVYYCNVRSSRGGVVVGNSPFSPSTDWSTGGPIIEREGIVAGPAKMANAYRIVVGQPCRAFYAEGPGSGHSDWDQYGPTVLVAAMRAYVARKLGDEVEGAKAGAERGGQ